MDVEMIVAVAVVVLSALGLGLSLLGYRRKSKLLDVLIDGVESATKSLGPQGGVLKRAIAMRAEVRKLEPQLAPIVKRRTEVLRDMGGGERRE